MILNDFYINEIITNALKEDINYIDCATDYLIPTEQISEGYFMAKADGVVCGIDIAMRVFTMLDSDFKFILHKKDGDAVKYGDIIAEFSGHTALLLKGERTALNLIQHMSGIATMTNRFVKEVEHTSAQITDTRKTLPGLRALQKYAVTVGGGKNHRFNLSDAAMLKDNHIDAGGGITKAVTALKSKIGHTVKIEVETRNLDEVKEAITVGADIIMLDNMDCDTMRKAVEMIGDKAVTEASGGINMDTIKSVAECGVDIISIGAITHSVTAFDISMIIKE